MMVRNEATELAAPSIVQATWRYRRMSAAIVVLFVIAGFGLQALIAQVRPPDSTATAVLALTDPRGRSVFQQGSGAGSDIVRYTSERAAFARSDEVLRRAAEMSEHRFSVTQLRQRIQTSSFPEDNRITISVMAVDPERAASAANAVAVAYEEISAADTEDLAQETLRTIATDRERILDSIRETDSEPTSPSAAAAERSAATNALSELELRASAVTINAELFGSGVNFIDPATVPARSSGLSALKTGAAAGLLGVLVAMALAWIRADRYQTADHNALPGPLLDSLLLGDVPTYRSPDDVAKLRDFPLMPADAYQFVSANLRSALPSGILLVVSATRMDGRTVTAASLATAAALEGRRVALVDADTRTRGLTAMAKVDAKKPGLTELASGEAGFFASVVSLELKNNTKLSFIPAGRHVDDIPSLYRTEGMLKVTERLDGDYDLVIFDCPPLLDTPDATSLIPHADGVLVVVRKGTPLRLLAAVHQQLHLFPTRLVGYVFSDRHSPGDPVRALGPALSLIGRNIRNRLRKKPAGAHW